MRRHVATGAAVGIGLTAALASLAYLGWQFADLPFFPFDIFDALTRALPGAVATVAIDTMVRAAGVLPFGTAATAKVFEQVLALGLVLAGGGICGALLFALLAASGEPPLFPGVVLGATLGGAVVALEQQMNRLTSPGAVSSAVWLCTTWAAWGAALGWVAGRPEARAFSHRTAPGDGPPAGGTRRRFLGRLGSALAGMTAFGTVVGALAGRRQSRPDGVYWSATHPLPNAGVVPTPVSGTRPELTAVAHHYRVDATTRPPALSGERWRLRVSGLVERPVEMTLAELRGREARHQFVTLECISNPVGGDLISTTRWTGVSLRDLLPDWRPAASASHLKVIAADGFFEVVATGDVVRDPRVMLAYAWDGEALPVEHGFPLRLFVPDRYGMKQPKWIVAIEAIDRWEAGYWVARGWDAEGRVRPTATVDTIAADAGYVDAAGRRVTPVGGIAHAAGGVSRVEVQVDGREWQPAALRPPLAETAWVLWRLDVPLAPGDHTVAARAYAADGAFQDRAPHTKRVRV